MTYNKHIIISIIIILFQLQTNYKSRESSIKQCIAVGANRLKILKEMKEEDSNNIALIKEMKGEQTKVT